MNNLKAGQLAKMIEITPHVLKEWERVLELAVPRDNQGHRYYDQAWLAFFQDVKQLVDANMSWDNISAKVVAPNAKKKSEPVYASAEPMPQFVY